MRRAYAAAAAVLALLALTACNEPENTDPRKGRVTTLDSDCLTGVCRYDWKVCVGGDLLVHISGSGDYWIRPSAECQS